jgi:hypothetical protein
MPNHEEELKNILVCDGGYMTPEQDKAFIKLIKNTNPDDFEFGIDERGVKILRRKD